MKFPLLSRRSQVFATFPSEQRKRNSGNEIQSILKESKDSIATSREAESDKGRVTFAKNVLVGTTDPIKDGFEVSNLEGGNQAVQKTSESFMESDTEDEREVYTTESRDTFDGIISDDGTFDGSVVTMMEDDDNDAADKTCSSCLCVGPAGPVCVGMKEEVVGTWEDTANSLYEVCHVFTLRENEILEVSGQIDHAKNEFLPVRRKWIKRHRRRTFRKSQSDVSSATEHEESAYKDTETSRQ
mmetsp:Transcript_14547/g.20554  ORF Transcript_14547/g.20554 Transcript_14547/m.20554 type:complete len:242 (-) Transcript_14547:198-923(-)